MKFDILTIFPDLLSSPLKEGIIKRSIEKNKVSIDIVNLRDHADGVHSVTDDRPFGGGEGMVMKVEPLARAVNHAQGNSASTSRVVLLSPQGRCYNQSIARELAQEQHLILVCGRYEGVDERFRASYVTDEISIGDFILTGGELAAMVLVDSIVRLLPGVLGCADSAEKDTFSRNLLKHPQYTRPRSFENLDVPEQLLSGNHKEIAEYRFIASIQRTLEKRPDLLSTEAFTRSEEKLLRKHGLYATIRDIQSCDGKR